MDDRVPNDRVRRVPLRKRLHIRSDDRDIEVLDLWSGGFSTDDAEPALSRGLVDIFDGSNHIRHGLVYLTEEHAGTRTYVFKTAQRPDVTPTADYVVER